ncbi:alpha/beta hydrolase [Actinomadura sp. B10D3]|uniref:alpha/beta fold hydrolase n=1 Tax=Actinomadura sp. B10D3 TaxID=3153557 RepID=UPI00325DCC8B
MPERGGQVGGAARRPHGGGPEEPVDLGQTRKRPRRRERAAEPLPRSAPLVVLVHGGFLGPWIWTETIGELERQGVRALSVDLPSMRAPDADLRDDARAVRDLLDGLDEVVLCGHSYAGMVISEAAAGPHRAVRHLVYLAAAIPDGGDSLSGLAKRHGDGGPGGEEAEELADGRVVLTPGSALEALFHDCPAERAAEAVALLRPANPLVNTQPVRGAAWRSLPFTRVRAADDRLPELLCDAAAERPHEVVTLPTGHCPQWSRPDLVAGVLARIARSLGQDNEVL